MLNSNRRLIIERVATHRLPAIFQWPETAEEGGFAAYGPRFDQVIRELHARQVAQILRGGKIADIPVEQPTKFELVINLKTAKALGLTIPEYFWRAPTRWSNSQARLLQCNLVVDGTFRKCRNVRFEVGGFNLSRNTF